MCISLKKLTSLQDLFMNFQPFVLTKKRKMYIFQGFYKDTKYRVHVTFLFSFQFNFHENISVHN